MSSENIRNSPTNSNTPENVPAPQQQPNKPDEEINTSPAIPPSNPEAPKTEDQPARRSFRPRKLTREVLAMSDESKTRKPKLSPACTHCRHSKIRCAHRTVMPDDGTEERILRKRKRDAQTKGLGKTGAGNGHEDEGSLSSEEEVDEMSSPLAKKALRVRWKDEEEGGEREQVNDDDETYSPLLSEAGWDAISKQRDGQDMEAATGSPAIAGEDRSGTAILEAPSRSRGEAKTDDQTDKSAKHIPTNTMKPLFPSFPADNLTAAAQLSIHTVFSKEVQQRLEECEARWLATIESFRSAKQALETWVEAWQRGS